MTKWSLPVEYETHEPGVFKSVVSTIEALRVLDGWWTKIDGPAFQTAINLCIDASRQDASPEDARAAFINALTEGGVLIKPLP